MTRKLRITLRLRSGQAHYALRTHYVPLIIILLLSTVLRFYHLSHHSLWSDEGNSVALARRGFTEIAQRTAFDIHPPFYYWLLKIWITIFGDSEIGLRSLSVVLGVGLVYLIWELGRRLFTPRIGLIAAFIAALSPLQIYYSQEARMYMLMSFLSAITVLAMIVFIENHLPHCPRNPYCACPERSRRVMRSLLYILVVTAGLYMHYAYPIILIVVNLVALVWFIRNSQFTIHNSQLIHWLTLQIIPIIAYLPWLPIAWRQITTWPSERQAISLVDVMNTISITLLFGLSWPYDIGLLFTGVVALALIIAGFRLRILRTTHYPSARLRAGAIRTTLPISLLLFFWFLLPVLVTLIVFSPAFLKFLLVATPPLALLLAVAIQVVATLPRRKWVGYTMGGLVLLALSGASLLSLYHYYFNPAFARDNYRGIAQFIKAVGSEGDAVILNAEGQQDVFNYYAQAQGLKMDTYPLPRRRPLDQAETLAELQRIANQSSKVYAVYWATEQADPTGLIEGWLNANLFKATDQWYGNVRLVSYAGPSTSANLDIDPTDYQLGDTIRLTGYGLSTSQIAPGDILQVALQWQTDALLADNYTIFLQILDQNNHLVGQRDAQPLTPTIEWPVNEAISNAHGVYVEPGTPPGRHRLIVGLYNSQTGQRLPVTLDDGSRQDFVELAQIDIVPSQAVLPLGAFKIQHPMGVSMQGVRLVGYDLYKVGHRSTPETPIHSGDPLRLVAYWMLENPEQWQVKNISIRVVKVDGAEIPIRVETSLANVSYSFEYWRKNEVIRAQYDLFLSDLEPGNYRVEIILYGPTSADVSSAVTKPFQVSE